MNRPGGSDAGFTLIEMLVALSVFAIAALALMRLDGYAISTAADLDARAMARRGHAVLVERLRGCRPAGIHRGEGVGEVADLNIGQRREGQTTPPDQAQRCVGAAG